MAGRRLDARQGGGGTSSPSNASLLVIPCAFYTVGGNIPPSTRSSICGCSLASASSGGIWVSMGGLGSTAPSAATSHPPPTNKITMRDTTTCTNKWWEAADSHHSTPYHSTVPLSRQCGQRQRPKWTYKDVAQSGTVQHPHPHTRSLLPLSRLLPLTGVSCSHSLEREGQCDKPSHATSS